MDSKDLKSFVYCGAQGLKPCTLVRATIQKLAIQASIVTKENCRAVFLAKKITL